VSATFLEVAILLAIGLGLTLYILLGGADFGGGVWDLLARGPAHERERTLIAAAIGPVWEANHVWLIFVVTVLFAAFPPAFAALGVALYVPFSLAVAGIVFRGAAFAFRSHGEGSAWQRRWTSVFGIASLVTPVVLGMAGAALASGRIRILPDGTAEAGLWSAWTGPLSIAAGALALAMCAFLAAVYLTVEADVRGDADLARHFRRRAVGSALVSGVLAGAGLVVVALDAPDLWAGMRERGWPLVLLSAAGGTASLLLILRRRDRAARVAAAVAVGSVVAGWGVAQWPYLIAPDLTVRDAAAPVSALGPIAVGLAVGGALLLPSLLLLFRVFKAATTPIDGEPRACRR
jgi:cytochrome bd ubiquinol oxidase subunit II